MSDMNTFSEGFLLEAQELLAEIEASVLDIEENPEDFEAVNRLFRAMHTIKGSGAMFGFDDIAAFTHHVETLLDKVREGSVAVTGELIDLILSSKDLIKSMLENRDIENGVDENRQRILIESLQAMLPGPDETEEIPSEDMPPPA